LQKEKETNPTDEELTFDEIIAKEINEDKEYWLSRVNDHLQKLLKKANIDNNIHKLMASRYQTRNRIASIKIEKLKTTLKEVQDKKRESRKRGKRVKLVAKKPLDV